MTTSPDESRKAQSHRAITPGTIAILLMGWLELIVSFTLLVMMDLPIIAMIFAVASVGLAFLSTQIRRPSWADAPSPRSDTPAPASSPTTRIILIVTIALALASLGGALWNLIAGDYLVAILMILWALSLTIQSTRLRAPK
jgi:hypothetical protein